MLVSIVFGETGEIRRSDAVCYPIPDRARALILLGRGKSDDLPNIGGLNGESYCSSCLVSVSLVLGVHELSALQNSSS